MDQLRHLHAGETVFRQGDAGDVAYLIREGQVAIVREEDGAERVIAVLQAGDIFGEMAVIDDRPRSATARAVCPTAALVIGAAQFRDRMENLDPLIANLLQTFVHRLGGGTAPPRADGAAAAAAETALRRRAIAKMQCEVELGRALEQGEFELFYQPIMDLDEGEVAGFEALIRWRRPDGSLVPPGEFIDVAEETSLIVPMGGWVLQEAMAGLARLQARLDARAAAAPPPTRRDPWSRPQARQLFMGINVAARQFAHPEFPDHVIAALGRTGVSPDRVKLEVTESALVRDPAGAAAQMQICRDLGCMMALDDFGTGYSSFAYLSRFPIDTIKIDRMFVKDMLTQRRSTAVVRGICGIAHGLQVPLVAEGIEEAEHVPALRAMGCTYGQGYLFARPLPEPEAAAFLDGASGGGGAAVGP